MNQPNAPSRVVRTPASSRGFKPFSRRGEAIDGVNWLPTSFDENSGQGIYFLRLAPTVRSFALERSQNQEIMVILGDLNDQSSNTYRSGDFIMFGDDFEPILSTKGGCILIVFSRGVVNPFVDAASRTLPFVKNCQDAEAFVPFDRYGTPNPHVNWISLSIQHSTGVGCYFSRFMQGGKSLPHEHEGYEEFLVIEGELIDNDGFIFKAGDFVTFAPGSRHFSQSPRGALLAVFLGGQNRRISEEEV